MQSLSKALVLIGLCCLGLFGVSQAAPVNVAPGSASTDDYLYVFGPRADKGSGKEDMLQIVFFEYPASIPEVELFVWNPSSGNRFERTRFLVGLWRDVETQFTVYGGQGAYSDGASRSARPVAEQPGNVLSQVTYGDDASDGWVSLGTYSTSQAEVLGNTAYLKLAAKGIEGDGSNFFKVGISTQEAKMFSYDITLHLPLEKEARMEFEIPVPASVETVRESNYDMDDSNVATLRGQELISSGSGVWVSNEVNVGTNAGTILYAINRGSQGFSNAGFHVTDLAGNGLPMYFSTTILPSQPQPAPEPAPVSAVDGQIDTTLLNLTKTMPEKAAIGEEFAVTLLLRAKTCIGDVVVTDMMPEGLELVSADPQPQRQGRNLVWTFDRLDPGDERQINLVVRATGVTTYENCMTVAAEPLVCTETTIGQPKLELAKSGPAEANLGSQVVYTIVVRNTGNYVARDLVVTDRVPEGMSHESGQRELTYQVAELPPGEARQVRVPLTANERGRFCNTATVTSSNAGEAQAEACTVVQQALLTINKTGTEEQFIGKRANYTIEVTNPGDIVLTDVVVRDQIPEGTTLVSAPDATVDGRQLTWRFPRLEPGKKIVGMEVVLTSRQPGNRVNHASVATSEGLQAKSQAPTLWKGYPALLIEVIDTNDPLQPGEETTYIITVTNQGSASDTNVRVNVAFPAEITPISASGDTQTRIDGKNVTVQPYPELAPGKVITWKVQARADQAGDSRLRVELRSGLLTNPVTEEESTQVY